MVEVQRQHRILFVCSRSEKSSLCCEGGTNACLNVGVRLSYIIFRIVLDAMKEKMFSQTIRCKRDMDMVEKTIISLMGHQENTCTFLRTHDFLKIRMCALYNKCSPPLSVYFGNFQIHLDRDMLLSIYLLSANVEEEAVVGTGKRGEPDMEDDG